MITFHVGYSRVTDRIESIWTDDEYQQAMEHFDMMPYSTGWQRVTVADEEAKALWLHCKRKQLDASLQPNQEYDERIANRDLRMQLQAQMEALELNPLEA